MDPHKVSWRSPETFSDNKSAIYVESHRGSCDILLQTSQVLADREGSVSSSRSAPGKAAAAAQDASAGIVLTPKNVHALRTLFNIAHRLHHLLGPAWVLVLDILNTLDKILQSPRTTTQVGCSVL